MWHKPFEAQKLWISKSSFEPMTKLLEQRSALNQWWFFWRVYDFFLGAGMQTILRRLLVYVYIYIYIPYIYYELYYNILYIYVCIFIYTLKYIYFVQQRMGMSQDWNTLFLKGRNNSWNVHVHDHLLEGIVHLGYMWNIQNIGKSWVSMNISGIYLPQIVSMSILAKQSVSWSCE